MLPDYFAILAVVLISSLRQDRKVLQCISASKCVMFQICFIFPNKRIAET